MPHMKPFAVFVLLILGAGCQAQAPATATTQPAEPEITTLHVGTRIVEISAVVKDKRGEPQSGLTKDDFILKQDGREEPIHYFSVGSDLPLTIALLVDVSGSQRTFIGDEWRASDIFLETMLGRRQDRATVVQIDARIKTLMAMTNSVSSLHLALTQLGSNASTANGTLLDDAVYLTSKNILSKEKGRKAIILLTDGGDNGSSATLTQAIEEAQRANVPVYAILYSAFAGFTQSSAAGRPHIDEGAALLKHMTESTGGRVYNVVPGTTLKAIYQQIGEELRTQYELGYTPPPDLKPNSFHKLELKAKDKKLAVQARNGFFVQP